MGFEIVRGMNHKYIVVERCKDYMNIAILIHALGGGGAERVAQIIGDYYLEKGNNVYYFLGDTSVKQVYHVKGMVINTGVKPCTSGNNDKFLKVLVKLLKASFRIRQYKRKYKIDVAISFLEEFNYLNVLSRGREKVITRVCSVLSRCSTYDGILYNKRMVTFFYSLADRVVVLSNDMIADMHNNYDISLKKLVKIPNTVLQVPLNDCQIDWEYGDKVIVTVGRLSVEKQQERIIRAFSYVYMHENTARLLILGSGPAEIYLKNLCKKYKLNDSVIFAGFKSNVGDYLQKSKVFVLASEVEGMPNSMLEAMANGVPVVTIDSPGACAEIVGRKRSLGKCKNIEYCPYGILTPYITGKLKNGNELDEEEILLGKAMLELLKNIELHKKYSKRSLKRASMYNLEKIMSKWETILK